ncbi:MAG: DUF4856 domain-containing protein [Myxococcota bacterium]|nr:DUF4856 domain-containing protein [Myxococcota bacterium]
MKFKKLVHAVALVAAAFMFHGCGDDDSSSDAAGGAGGAGAAGGAGGAGAEGGAGGAGAEGGAGGAGAEGGAGGAGAEGGAGGAGAEGGAGGAGGGDDQAAYEFESRYVEGESSVSNSGQMARHALISAVKAHIGGLTARLDDGSFAPAAGDVRAEINNYFDCAENACEGEDTLISTDPPAKQSTFGEISGGKNLVGKIAGNDATGQHKDWITDGIVGWTGAEGAPISPEALVRAWTDMLDAQSVAYANGEAGTDPQGNAITKVFVSAEGHDLQQLIQKFLLGSLAFSQGADDYLDDDVEGKGILASNDAVVDGKTYTALEHNWDEGFGYFGAARDYADYTDDEIAGKGGRDDWQKYHDTNGDGFIDLKTEYNFGHSVNAAKRDRGASTDMTRDAFHAFYAGRDLITTAGGALTPEQMEELKTHRDVALLAWEQAIAATVIHYINDTIGAMEAAEYDFYNHAKYWGEMKGFALSFQFNRRSPVTPDAFARIHQVMGTAPELNAENFEAYKGGLLEARAILGQAYGFDEADVADW